MQAKLITEELMIPVGDAGIELYVRNKRPQAMTRFSADNIVLFMHGATYPAETSFDLSLDGLSWMDYIAGCGYDAYLVNVRGFGRSTRPPEMNQPAASNPLAGEHRHRGEGRGRCGRVRPRSPRRRRTAAIDPARLSGGQHTSRVGR